MILLPGRKTGIVVLNNLGSALPGRVAWRLADRLLGAADSAEDYRTALEKAAQDRRQPDEDASTRSAGKAPPPSLPLSAYAGTWFHPAFGDIRVEVAGQGLSIAFDAVTLELEHDNHDTFRWSDYGPPRHARFVLDAAGKAAELHLPLERAAPDYVFTRH